LQKIELLQIKKKVHKKTLNMKHSLNTF